MGKKWKIAYIFLLLLGLCGCEKTKKIAPAVVTQVQIACVHEDERFSCNYTDPERISAVLDSLRLQRSQGTAQVDPERIIGDAYEIRIILSDGTEHTYRHRSGRYLSKDSGQWKVVSREDGERLYRTIWENI